MNVRHTLFGVIVLIDGAFNAARPVIRTNGQLSKPTRTDFISLSDFMCDVHISNCTKDLTMFALRFMPLTFFNFHFTSVGSRKKVVKIVLAYSAYSIKQNASRNCHSALLLLPKRYCCLCFSKIHKNV